MSSQILIVDDDPALLEALSEALRLRIQDVDVETCESARTALDRIGATDYDAIVADIKMPGMDGMQLLGQILKLRPARRTRSTVRTTHQPPWRVRRGSSATVAAISTRPGWPARPTRTPSRTAVAASPDQSPSQ